jgi:CBS domain containing-hemolysin-like protein
MKKKWGTPDENTFVDQLLPLTKIRPRHRVLVTLLLCNSLFNEALPTFLSDCMPRLLAVIVAVFSVLIFGEIIPSALCTGPNKLAIASYFTPFLRILLTVVAPVAVPIAALLDFLVPEDDNSGGAPSRPGSKQQLMSLVAVQREMARERGDSEPFDQDEENMIRGVLSLSSLTAETAGILRPREQVFSLPLDLQMNNATVIELLIF